jgi:hypothetical protein
MSLQQFYLFIYVVQDFDGFTRFQYPWICLSGFWNAVYVCMSTSLTPLTDISHIQYLGVYPHRRVPGEHSSSNK